MLSENGVSAGYAQDGTAFIKLHTGKQHTYLGVQTGTKLGRNARKREEKSKTGGDQSPW